VKRDCGAKKVSKKSLAEKREIKKEKRVSPSTKKPCVPPHHTRAGG
jgi:hypothetical protein